LKNSPMCGHCELLEIAKEIGQMPLVLTPEETARVMRMAVSSVYMKAAKGEIPLASNRPKRIPTLWVLRKLGFEENRFEDGTPLKLVKAGLSK